MGKPKVTPWFPGDVKPVRKGLYECRWCVENGRPHSRHFWHGKHWDEYPFAGWRGLAEQPK